MDGDRPWINMATGETYRLSCYLMFLLALGFFLNHFQFQCKLTTKSGRGKKKVDDSIAALKKNVISCSYSVPENAMSLRCLSDILNGLLV